MDYKEALRQLHITLAGAKHKCGHDPQRPPEECPLCRMVRTLRRVIRGVEAEERDAGLRRLTEEIEATNSNPELLAAIILHLKSGIENTAGGRSDGN
jgi:hypothetical protein